jgi:CRP-like cAMP-binding protein
MLQRQRVLSGIISPDYIHNIQLFSGLAETEKEALCKGANVYSYPKKEVLFRQGDPITRFYIICSGAVKLCHATADGHEITNHLRTAGDTMNATAAFTSVGRVHGSNAIMVKDSVILDYSIDWLKQIVEQYPSVAGNLLHALSARAQDLELEVKNQAYMSCQQLLACFLTKTCVSEGLDPRGFRLPYSKSLIASRLRTTQETLSRILPRLKDFGITAESKNVRFDNLQSLETNLCSHCPGAEKCYARKIMQKASLDAPIAAANSNGFNTPCSKTI